MRYIRPYNFYVCIAVCWDPIRNCSKMQRIWPLNRQTNKTKKNNKTSRCLKWKNLLLNFNSMFPSCHLSCRWRPKFHKFNLSSNSFYIIILARSSSQWGEPRIQVTLQLLLILCGFIIMNIMKALRLALFKIIIKWNWHLWHIVYTLSLRSGHWHYICTQPLRLRFIRQCCSDKRVKFPKAWRSGFKFLVKVILNEVWIYSYFIAFSWALP